MVPGSSCRASVLVGRVHQLLPALAAILPYLEKTDGQAPEAHERFFHRGGWWGGQELCFDNTAVIFWAVIFWAVSLWVRAGGWSPLH